MGTCKGKLNIIIGILISVLFMMGNTTLVQADVVLTQDEKNYIEEEGIIKAVSLEGTAPFQYTDKEGVRRGISFRILDEIAQMTGLTFEYELYDSIEEIFESDYDLVFGVSPDYSQDDLLLSKPYLEAETILYINHSVDPNRLDNKIYAAIEGGTLPEEIKAKEIRYYKTREESLTAVEMGEADYGHGNAYSIAFYTRQNNYKNMVTIPKAKESRAYSIGVPKENVILASLVNKSLEAIDESKMYNLILEETSYVEKRITFSAIMSIYGKKIISIMLLMMSLLIVGVIKAICTKNKLKLQNKRYEQLAHISNEYLYDYYAKDNILRLSKKCIELFGTEEYLTEAIHLIKESLRNNHLKENVQEIRLPLMDGEIGVFKIVSSPVSNNRGKVHSVIGKLIDITKDVAEKNELIIQAEVDGLTDVYNQATTKKLINKSIKNKPQDQMDALIVMDFDKFKYINDTYGHLKGDDVLKRLGRALKLTFRENDIIGRVGGDEFCVYMKNIHSMGISKLKCEQVNALIKGHDPEVFISISAGIAQLKEEKTYEALFEKADSALYEAKKQGTSKAYVYVD